MFNRCLATLTLTAMLTGCATPPVFISASPVTNEQKERLRQIDCDQLMTSLAMEESREKSLSSDMAGRAAKQLLLNAIAVGTLATIGFGMTYTAHGEGNHRDALRRSRGDIEAMRAVATEKRCPPVAATAAAPTETPSAPAAASPAAIGEPTTASPIPAKSN
jgi:hypothetical protein